MEYDYLLSIMSHLNPDHTLTSYFFQITFKIILPSVARSPRQSLRCKFPTKIVHAFLISTMSHPIHLPWFDNPNNIQWRVQIMKLLIMQFSPCLCYFLSLRSKYSSQHPTLRQEVQTVQEKLVKLRTQWYGHVTRMDSFECQTWRWWINDHWGDSKDEVHRPGEWRYTKWSKETLEIHEEC